MGTNIYEDKMVFRGGGGVIMRGSIYGSHSFFLDLDENVVKLLSRDRVHTWETLTSSKFSILLLYYILYSTQKILMT